MRAFAAILCLTSGAVAGAPREWTRATTPNFDVFSTLSDDQTRESLAGLEAVRLRAQKLTGWRSRGGVVRVVLAPDIESGYVLSLSRDHLHIAPPVKDHLPAVLLDYARLWLRRSGRDLPPWMSEGLAQAIAASPIPPADHMVPLETLFDLDSRSVPQAQARIVVEFLLTTYGDKFPALLDALALRQSVEQFTGKTPAQLEQAGGSFVARPAPLNPRMPAANRAQPAQVDVDLLEIELATPAGREAGSVERLAALARRYEQSPQVWCALASAQLTLGRSDDARASYQRAWSANPTDAEALFQYALLLDPNGAEVVRVLERVIQFDSSNWDARLRLARNALAQKQAERARRCLQPLPEPSAPEAPEYYRLQSQAARLTQHRDEARAAADRMAAIANTSELRREAEDMRRMAADTGEPAARAKTEQGITISDARNPGGRIERGVEAPRMPETYGPKVVTEKLSSLPSLEGDLTRVDCMGEQAVLTIDTGRGSRKFRIADGRQVVVRSNSGAEAELPCGVLAKPMRVRVEYEDRPEPVLRLIEFQ